MSSRAPLPEPQRTVARYLDHWVDRGLLAEETATRLRQDLATRAGAPTGTEADGPPSEDRAGGVERLLDAAKSLAFETLGYLGAAVSVGALVVLLDLVEWPEAAHIALLAVIAAVAGWGTWVLTPPSSGSTRRLAAVTGVVSVLATGGALALALDPHCSVLGTTTDRCTYAEEYLRPLAVVLPTLALAVALYRRHRHLLTHAAMGGLTLAAVFFVVEAVLGPDVSSDVRDLWMGLALAAAAVLWMWGAETDRLVPAWLGTFAAGGVLFAGVALLTHYPSSLFFAEADDDATILASLMIGAVLGLLGVLSGRYRLTVIGSLALLVTVPATLTEVLGLSGTTTALILLPFGVALTVWAVVEGRDSIAQGAASTADHDT